VGKLPWVALGPSCGINKRKKQERKKKKKKKYLRWLGWWIGGRRVRVRLRGIGNRLLLGRVRIHLWRIGGRIILIRRRGSRRGRVRRRIGCVSGRIRRRKGRGRVGFERNGVGSRREFPFLGFDFV